MEVTRYIRQIELEAPDIKEGASVSTTAITIHYCSNDTRYHQVEVYGSPELAREIHRFLLTKLINKKITLEIGERRQRQRQNSHTKDDNTDNTDNSYKIIF